MDDKKEKNTLDGRGMDDIHYATGATSYVFAMTGLTSRRERHKNSYLLFALEAYPCINSIG
jgi:hypothetical protein